MTSAPPPVKQAVKEARWLWPAVLMAAAGALAVAFWLIDQVSDSHALGFDTAILLALRQPGHPDIPIGPSWLLQSAIDISALGGFTLEWLLGGAGCLFLVALSRRAEAAWLVGSLAGASIIDTALKQILHRPRPDLVPHLVKVTNASFPSGHAMTAAAVYLTLALMLASSMPNRHLRVALLALAVGLAALIGASRVYLGVHWPSDVAAGWCLGSVWALGVYGVNRFITRRQPAKG